MKTQAEIDAIAATISFEAFPDHLPQREVRICPIMDGAMTVSARIQEWNGAQATCDMRLSIEFRAQSGERRGLPMAIVHDAFLHRRGKVGIGAVVTEAAVKLARKELWLALRRLENGTCQPGWEQDAVRSGDKPVRAKTEHVEREVVQPKTVEVRPKPAPKALGDVGAAIEAEVRDLKEAVNG
jgi:hypothetical protein